MWYEMIVCHGDTQYDMGWDGNIVWNGLAWYSMAYGMVWYGILWLWYSMVWYSMVEYGMIIGIVYFNIVHYYIWTISTSGIRNFQMLIHSGTPDPQWVASTTPLYPKQALHLREKQQSFPPGFWCQESQLPSRVLACALLSLQGQVRSHHKRKWGLSPGLPSLSSGSPHLTNQEFRAVNSECQNLCAHGLTPANACSHLLQGQHREKGSLPGVWMDTLQVHLLPVVIFTAFPTRLLPW